MRSFLLFAFALLLAAASIFAAPIQGEFERRSSSSSADSLAIFARNIPVTFGHAVPAEHRQSIENAIQHTHSQLDPNHSAFHAQSAHVDQWHQADGPHQHHIATANFFASPTPNANHYLNTLDVHIKEPGRRHSV